MAPQWEGSINPLQLKLIAIRKLNMQEITLQESKDICGGRISDIGWLSVLCPLAYIIGAGVNKNPNPSKWC
jgi:hypothetical protein